MIYDWSRAAIVAEARSWLGTPYRHQTSIKGLGADCIGLIGGVPRNLGMPSGLAWANDPAMKGYSATPNEGPLMAAVSKYLVPIERAAPGDILLMRWEDDPGHFAIVSQLAPLMIVHAFSSARKVSEHNIAGFWRQGITWSSRILSAWAYREATD